MTTNAFGDLVRDTRENAKISLRKFAQETKLDPAYLSRIERGVFIAPREEIVERIANALCDLQDLPMAECEKLNRELLEAAGHRTKSADLIAELEERLKDNELDLNQLAIHDVVNKISPETRDRVLSGKEALEIGNQDDYSYEEIKKRKSQGEQVEYLSMSESSPVDEEPSATEDSASYYINKNLKKFKASSRAPSSPSPRRRSRAVKKTKFRAGTRAFIEVDGDLTSNQEELLRSITNTVRSILKGK
jgi:transcriptional regulator with XRE-family HTH domain